MTLSGDNRPRGSFYPQSLIERRMSKFLREPPSVRLAASVIVTATVVIVAAGGVLMRFVNHSAYHSVWIGMWWVLQTVTTVGFGDVPPTNKVGFLVTAAVMLWGIAFLTITTAAITSVFVTRAQRERALGEQEEEAPVMAGLVRVDQQLADLTAHSKQVDEQLQRLTELLEKTQPKS
jgi:voltage-gated potassium channel